MHRILLPGLLLVAALAQPAFSEEWTRNYSVSGRSTLRIETDDAGVQVRAGGSGQIEVRVTTKGFSIGHDDVRITDRQSGNRVELEVRMPNQWGSFGNRWVKVEVLVPRETDLDIHTGDGGVTVVGTKGDARLSTGDGGIHADDLDGNLEAKTGDGGVRVSGRFDVLNVKTGDGGIEASIAKGSRLSTAWQIRTGDGGVRVRVPSDLDAELDLRTGDGSVHLDLPLLVSGTQQKHWIRGKLNAGGPTFTIHTNDGSITVNRL